MEKLREMASSKEDQSQFVKNSVLYKEFLAEREEILKHKWIESEKAGKDIGFEKALLDYSGELTDRDALKLVRDLVDDALSAFVDEDH